MGIQDVISALGFDVISVVGISILVLASIHRALYRCSSAGCKIGLVVLALGASSLLVWILSENGILAVSPSVEEALFWSVVVSVAVGFATVVLYRSEYSTA